MIRKINMIRYYSKLYRIQYWILTKILSDDVIEDYTWDNNLLDDAYNEAYHDDI